MTAHTRFDIILTPLLNQAVDLSGEALALVDRLLPEGITAGTMPDGTVYRLHIAATATYRSGIVCLRSPETSVAAFSLLRGLLEAWSHLAFIGDDTEGGNSTCRALRYERGALKEWSDSVHDAPPVFDRDAWQQQHEPRAAAIDALWRELQCSGSTRTRKHVDATLAKLAKLPRMEWIPGVWRATSATVHMYGVDFAFDDRGDSTSDLVWALPRYRATWLSFLAAAYGYLTVTAASILHCQDLAIQRFHDAMRRLVEAKELRQALDGTYDRKR